MKVMNCGNFFLSETMRFFYIRQKFVDDWSFSFLLVIECTCEFTRDFVVLYTIEKLKKSLIAFSDMNTSCIFIHFAKI